MSKKIKKFLSGNYFIGLVLILAAVLRIYRLNDLLGFWYDQGRDALSIWAMLYENKFTLIGQQMGFTGIFRGGWFYYLLAPFYFIGKGNPIYPTVFLILTSVFAIYILYILGVKLGGKKTGMLAAFIAAISYYIVSSSNWLSGTTPELLVSMLIVWAVFKFLEKKIWAVPLIGLLVGMSFQFEGATEIYFVPAIILIFILKRKILPSFKVFILSVLLFLFPLTPQVVFEFRHPGVLSGALNNFIFHEKTFTFSFWEIFKTRAPYYYRLFASKIWTDGYSIFAPFFGIFIITLVINLKKFWRSDHFKVLFIFALAPFVGTLFFVSNLGAVYDYYFTCYYLIWILLFSFVLMSLSKKFLGKLLIAVFLVILIVKNSISYKNHYFVSLDNPNITTFNGQLRALDWIYFQAGGKDFNVDVYVPPVIPYEFNYLFKWYGQSKYGYVPIEENIPLLYTIYEVDNFHPSLLEKWLARQEGIAEVVKEQSYGGITVQERTRIKK